MYSRSGYGVISLLAMTCFAWAVIGLLDTSAADSTGSSEVPSTGSEKRLPALPLVASFSNTDWERGDVVEAAIALSLLPEPDFRTDLEKRDAGASRLSEPGYGGLPGVRRFVRGRPVAEAPTWLILSVAVGGLLSRRRALQA